MKLKKEVLVFPYLCFVISFLAAKENFSFLAQLTILLFLSLSIWAQIKSRFFFSGKIRSFLVLFSGIIVFLLLRMNLVEFLTYFLVLLVFLKFFSPTTPRDVWQIYALSFVLLCVSSIWNFNISIGFLILAFAWCSITGLCLLNGFERDPLLKNKNELILFSSLTTLLVFFIALVFFFFLPRSPYTFSVPFGISRGVKIGFSEEIDIESVEKIREDDEVAFRAVVSKRPHFVYWRGIVYDTYIGGHWIRSLKDKCAFKKGCSYIKQTIFLEPYRGKFLFGLDYPYKINILKPKGLRFYIGSDLCFELSRSIDSRIVYEVYSCGLSDFLPATKMDDYLQVPDRLKPFLISFLEEHKITGTSKEIAEKIKRMLTSKPFRYSRKTERKKKYLDPVVDFLYNTHCGWCEHFASSAVLLLRSAGVPARLIGGYYGGVWNSMGSYFIVRQKNAHSWVEYFDGKKWRRLDPTPTLSLSRYKHEISFVAQWLDFLRIKWYFYIISYDYYKQRRFFKFLKSRFTIPKMSDFNINFSYKNISLQKKFLWFFTIVFFLFLFIIFLYLKRRNRSLGAYLRHVIEKSGFEIKRSEGLLDIGKRMKTMDEVLGYMIMDFADEWYRIRFGGKSGNFRSLKNRVKEIKQRLRLLYKHKGSF